MVDILNWQVEYYELLFIGQPLPNWKICQHTHYFVSPYSHLSQEYNQKKICNQNFLTFTSLNFCELKSTPANLYQLTLFIKWGGILAHRLNTCQTLLI